MVIEKKNAVADRLVPNSSAMGRKNSPKLYATPNTVNIARNAATNTTHDRVESSPCAAPGSAAGRSVGVVTATK